MSESLLAKVRAVPGVAAVEGSVNGEALLVDQKGKAIVFGGAPNLGFSIANPQSPFNVAAARGGRVAARQRGRDRQEHGRPEALPRRRHDRRAGRGAGAEAEDLGPRHVRLGGLTRRRDARRLRPADRPAALRQAGQARRDRRRRRIRGSPTRRSCDASRRSCRRTAQARTGAAQAAKDAKDTNSFISFLRGFLLAFGGIALFVGSFVIANSLSITIAQRTRELATMRTLGASRRQVLTSIIVEALVIGVAGVGGRALPRPRRSPRASSGSSTPSGSRCRTTASPSRRARSCVSLARRHARRR